MRSACRRVREWHYDDGQVKLARGDEMGRFLLGSTVVLLFAPRPGERFVFNPAWAPAGSVRLGEAMGDWAGVDDEPAAG